MPKCTIDGQEVEFKAGENLIEVAKRVGTNIPYFCYHPGQSVVAQCRMCTVEIEKMPKLQTACSTPAAEGMVVHTKSEKALQNQKSVMEFLLINHPLDCPVCDKSGECDLQDNSFKHGDPYMRYTEERRTYMDLDMGPVIKKNMNRCIHCTRCIRFGEEVAGIHEMVAIKRGNNTEITTIDGRPLETDYAGNYADICPTGSLTLKDFRFRKRAWFLKKTETVCEGCSRGCAIELQHEGPKIYRTIARENLEVNKYWICDEGRFHYRMVNDPKRVTSPQITGNQGKEPIDWNRAIDQAKSLLKGKKTAILVGTDLTQEELKLVQQVAQSQFHGAVISTFGTPSVRTSKEDGDEDRILKKKSKTSNLNGAEKLGLSAWTSVGKDIEAVVVISGGRAILPNLSEVKTRVGLGVFLGPQAEQFQVVLPGTTFAEKDGTIFNFEGREQKLKRAISPVGDSKQLSEIFMIWTHRTGSSTGAA